MGKTIQFQSFRRFGVEIELNTTNGEVKQLGYGESPEGTHDVACLVREATRQNVEIQSWSHTHNNNSWIIKPDRSCGIELCSPVLKGWDGLESILRVVESLAANGMSADERCSFHVHVNVSDLTLRSIGSIIARYIKCEPTFMEAMPRSRRVNRFCQCIGMSDLFDHDIMPTPSTLIQKISVTKYHSINAYHMRKEKRKTLEFRIGDNSMCLDAYAAKNWIRLLLHFVEITKDQSMPFHYKDGNKWTGLVWVDPEDVLIMLRLNEENLSLGMRQVRDWFVGRLLEGVADESPPYIWASGVRRNALEALRVYLDHPAEKVLYGAEYAV